MNCRIRSRDATQRNMIYHQFRRHFRQLIKNSRNIIYYNKCQKLAAFEARKWKSQEPAPWQWEQPVSVSLGDGKGLVLIAGTFPWTNPSALIWERRLHFNCCHRNPGTTESHKSFFFLSRGPPGFGGRTRSFPLH